MRVTFKQSEKMQKDFDRNKKEFWKWMKRLRKEHSATSMELKIKVMK